MRVQLREFCQVRSGDKGDTVDISLFAPTPALYEVLKEQVTAERVASFFAPVTSGPVTRYEVRNVLALKFVINRALGGGAARTLRSDNLGKAYGANLLHLDVEVDPKLLEGVPSLRYPDSVHPAGGQPGLAAGGVGPMVTGLDNIGIAVRDLA